MKNHANKSKRPQREPSDHEHALTNFLAAVHYGTDGGFIEVRVIEDKKGGELVERKWYAAIVDLVVDLPRLLRFADARNSGIFFGVLPRKECGKGTAEDVLPGAVLWADIDFRDFKGGEVEARAVLARFPIAPSIVVRSGHGLHCYWLLREAIDPKEIAALNRRLARALGADHAHDAARILRLPTTLNRKDPATPILVELETLEPERRCNASEIEEALEVAGVPDSAAKPAPVDDATGPIEIADQVPERVDMLIRANRRIADLFLGRGKPPKRTDGAKLDDSTSGYDFSFIKALAEAGVTGASELATALWCRPDGKARAKGAAYVERTVRNVLALVLGTTGSDGADAGAADFQVTRVRIYSTAQPQYEFEVEGRRFTVNSAVLNNRSAFRVRLTDALQRVPTLPPDKAWAGFVNGLLQQAEVTELPVDTGDEAAQLEDLELIITNKTISDAPADLNAGSSMRLSDERVVFKLGPVVKAMRAEWPDLTRAVVATLLRKAGFVDDQVRLPEGASARIWTRDGSPSQ